MIRIWLKTAVKERLFAKHERKLREIREEVNLISTVLGVMPDPDIFVTLSRLRNFTGNLILDLAAAKEASQGLRRAQEDRLQLLEGMSKNVADRARIAHNVRLCASKLTDDSERNRLIAILDGADPEKL